MIRELRGTAASRRADCDLPGLCAGLAELVGQPFRFLRFSYGDELTIHFGELRPGRVSKLKDMQFGSYILGLRCSPWLLRSGSGGTVFDDARPPAQGDAVGSAISQEELESRALIEPGSLVIQASPFVDPLGDAIGLELRFSDGSHFVVRPGLQEPEGPDEDDLIELADWELLGPIVLIEAGPGPRWSIEPTVPPPPRSRSHAES